MPCRRTRLIGITGLASGMVLLVPGRADAFPGDGVVRDVVGAGIDVAFQQMTVGMVTWLLKGVGYFVEGVVHFLQTATHPQVTAMWFAGPDSPYASVRSMSVLLMMGFVLLGICSGLLHGDVSGMVRRIAGGIPFAVVGMFVTTTIVDKLLTLTDSLSAGVLDHAGSQSMTFMQDLTLTSALTGTGGFPTFLVALAAVLAAFLLWIELIVRSALVYFLVALTPLAFAATLWPAARGVLRKLMELLVAAIFSKLAVCIALSIGSAALVGVAESTPADSDVGIGTAAAMGTGTLFAGAALLIMAAYSPFLLLRMIPLIEGAVVANGVSRGPLRAAQAGMNTTSSVSSIARLAGSVTNAPGGRAGGKGATSKPSADRLAGATSSSGKAKHPSSPSATSSRSTSPGPAPTSPTASSESRPPVTDSAPAAASSLSTTASSARPKTARTPNYEPSAPPPGSQRIANSPDVTSTVEPAATSAPPTFSKGRSS